MRNCYLRSEHRLVVGLGLEDLVVVETNDAVLVARRDQTQAVKQVVARLQADGRGKPSLTSVSTGRGGTTTPGWRGSAGR